jgi:hypothetical protein
MAGAATAIFLSFLLVSSLIISLMPTEASAEDVVAFENWPVFRAGTTSSVLEPSVDIDAEGVVHLTYLHRDPSDAGYYLHANMLRYANFSDGQWQHVDLKEANYSFVDLVVAGDGVHILCAERGDGSTDIVHWNNTNGTWTSEIVAHFETDDAENLDMVVDHHGDVHAVFSIGDDLTQNYTCYYLTNAGENWSIEPVYTFLGYANLLITPPDLTVDPAGTVHLAYVNVTGFTSGDWGSGDWYIKFLTRGQDGWVDERNLSVDGQCNSISLQVDVNGYEHVLYHYSYPGPLSVGPVVLATRTASGWSWGGICDGVGYCDLMLNDEGEEIFTFMDDDYHLFVSNYQGGDFDRIVGIPQGTYLISRDPVARTGNSLVCILYDLLGGDLLISRPSENPSLSPRISSLELQDGIVEVDWDEVSPMEGPSVSSYLLFRSDAYRIGPFFLNPSETNYTDTAVQSLLEGYGPVNYRLSVVTVAGEEYIGNMDMVILGMNEGVGWELNELLLPIALAMVLILATVMAWSVHIKKE